MIIRILDKNYFVQQTIPSEKGLVQYVCLNVSEDDGRIYRIVRIPVREVKQEKRGHQGCRHTVGQAHGRGSEVFPETDFIRFVHVSSSPSKFTDLG